MVKDYSVNKVSNIVKGGCTRQKSVFNAVRCCMTESDYIAIHDGARPLVNRETIEKRFLRLLILMPLRPVSRLKIQ